MGFLDDKSKKTYWWNKNYYFATTLMVIVLLLCLYVFNVDRKVGVVKVADFVNLSNFLQHFINCFFHFNLVHIIFNCISFLICGLYLERKIGSIPMLLLVIILAIFGASFRGSISQSTTWAGFSVVNFAFFGFIFINFLFSLQKERRTKTNIIWGLITLAFIYFLMCADYRRNVGTLFTLGSYNIGLTWYPIDLLICDGHLAGFMAGAIICLILEIYKIFVTKSKK